MNKSALMLARVVSAAVAEASAIEVDSDQSEAARLTFVRQMQLAKMYLETAALCLFMASGATKENLK